MKKLNLVLSLTLAVAFFLGVETVQSQPGIGGYGYGMGRGMMDGYGPGYNMGTGMMGDWIDIPAKLPTPQNAEWVEKLREIQVLEKQSFDQYEADQEQFNAYMPYMMVIPQEANHIEWIGQLFIAYGLIGNGKVVSVVKNTTLEQAYEISLKLEGDLLPRYEWLLKKAEDSDTAEVLNAILIQSRWHLVMFEHAARIGHGYGYSRGLGMMGGYGSGMGPGMMDGPDSGYGMGRGYGRRSHLAGKPIDVKEAEAIMTKYLKSTRNPNLKMGEIKDAGDVFETEILTKKNDLVDKILIDKETGYLRSAY